jgi:hypothetical protein
VFDLAREIYLNRPVSAAVTMSVADLLDAGGADAARGVVLSTDDLDLEGTRPAPSGRWRDDLALWARRDEGIHLVGCVT